MKRGEPNTTTLRGVSYEKFCEIVWGIHKPRRQFLGERVCQMTSSLHKSYLGKVPMKGLEVGASKISKKSVHVV